MKWVLRWTCFRLVFEGWAVEKVKIDRGAIDKYGKIMLIDAYENNCIERKELSYGRL